MINQKTTVTLCLLALTTLLIACSDSAPTSVEPTTIGEKSPVDFSLPRTIAESRAVDWQAVEPVVTIGQSTVIPMIPDTDEPGRWNSDMSQPVRVPEGSVQRLIVEWYEDYQNEKLLLVRQRRENVTVQSGEIYAIEGAIEEIEFDFDQDGIYNLLEREENTDPLDRNSGVNVVITRVDPDDAPIIDGGFISYKPNELKLDGEWADSVQTDRAGTTLAINNVMADLSGAGQVPHYHHWAAVHDGTYLYLLVISDDDALHISDSPTDIYNDDEVEIYIDGDNSKLESYDNVNDFQIHLALLGQTLGDPNDSTSAFARVEAGINSAPLPQDLTFSIGTGKGPRSPRVGVERQDIYEIRIRLDELGIEPNRPFGLEIQLNDDDDGGDRDTKWGWFHPEGDDAAWYNPTFFGNAILQ